jgi:hypothetical protein
MIRNGVLAALFGVWAVSLPSDLHIAQRALLVVGFVPLVRMAYHLWRRRIVVVEVLILERSAGLEADRGARVVTRPVTCSRAF